MARRSRQSDSPEVQRRKSELLTAFGRKVRQARTKAGLTQAQLGQGADLAQSYIFEIETMGANVTLEALASLASCLKVSMKDLVPENEFETLTPASSSELCSTLERVAESLSKTSGLLSEVQRFAELRERLERLAEKGTER
jgi:transcriptional regulator with XRE-family HTH domain